ncbi:hypothetical protein B4Q13_18830 [Lacticaseibacillus rhamnosus]
MNFDLTEEQELVRSTVRDFAEQKVAPVAEELDREHRCVWLQLLGGESAEVLRAAAIDPVARMDLWNRRDYRHRLSHSLQSVCGQYEIFSPRPIGQGPSGPRRGSA